MLDYRTRQGIGLGLVGFAGSPIDPRLSGSVHTRAMAPKPASPSNALAARLGARLRRARFALRKTQGEVAAEAGVSQSTISRVELGRGGFVPLTTWERIAAAVGVDLSVAFRTPARERSDELGMRCHRMVADLAGRGGWSAWTIATPDDPALTETILERPERREVAVVRVWDVLGDVEAGIAALRERLDGERIARDDGWVIGGAVVVAATGANRRRLSETGAPVARAFSLRGDDWLAALGKSRVPIPDALGMIWTDERIERLRPLIPYVDFRPRVRGQDQRRRAS
jgi:transcriptional regulator with XRE-family HTH domain